MIEKLMTQAQVFASAWALVGSRFDQGGEIDNANAQKEDLRKMIADLVQTNTQLLIQLEAAKQTQQNAVPPQGLEDFDLNNLAASACAEALAYGVSENSFERLAKLVQKKVLEAVAKPVLQ